MNEGYKPANETIESLDAWRTLKEEAPERAKTLLAERQLPATLEGLSFEESTESVAQLSELIEELSSDNANRYVVRELSLYRQQMEKYSEFIKIPPPAFARAT